jgi:hypothetical protein
MPCKNEDYVRDDVEATSTEELFCFLCQQDSLGCKIFTTNLPGRRSCICFVLAWRKHVQVIVMRFLSKFRGFRVKKHSRIVNAI